MDLETLARYRPLIRRIATKIADLARDAAIDADDLEAEAMIALWRAPEPESASPGRYIGRRAMCAAWDAVPGRRRARAVLEPLEAALDLPAPEPDVVDVLTARAVLARASETDRAVGFRVAAGASWVEAAAEVGTSRHRALVRLRAIARGA